MHYRATIPDMTARHVVVDLLASWQVARMKAATRPPGSRPMLQRFWGTVCQDGETTYLPSSSMIAVSSCLSRNESRPDRADGRIAFLERNTPASRAAWLIPVEVAKIARAPED